MGKSISKVILLFLLFSSSCFAGEFKHFNEWETSEKAEFSAFVALSAIDYSQSTWAMRQKDSNGNPLYYEWNPLYGKRPSNEKIALGQLLGIAAYYCVIGNQNPKFVRGIVLGVKLGVVLHNDSVGIGISKSF